MMKISDSLKISFEIPSEIQNIIQIDIKSNQISSIKFRMIQNIVETNNSTKTIRKIILK